MLAAFNFYCISAIFHMDMMQYWDKQSIQEQTNHHYGKAIVAARVCGYHRAKYKIMIQLAEGAL